MGLLNREKLPDALKALIPKGERLMAWGSGPPKLDGQPTLVAATDRALYAPGYVERVPWEQVVRAAWEEPILEVVYLPPDESTAAETVVFSSPALVRITLDEAGSVPQVVWERVNSTIIMSRHVTLVGDKGVRLVARRVRGSDDIRWHVIFDRGLDAADPELRAMADEELRHIRESAGI